MARRDSHLRSTSRPAPVLGEERDRNPETATDTPTSDPPLSDPPTTGTPATARPSTGTAETEHPSGSGTRRPGTTSNWLGWGAVSGLLAGIAFLALHSWFAVSMGRDASAPLRTMATIVEGPPASEAVEEVGSPRCPG